MAAFPPPQAYWLDLNRLRLKLDATLSEQLGFNLQYDNEAYFGDYLESNEFASLIKDRQTDTALTLEKAYVDNKQWYIKHRIYRAYLDFTQADVSLRMGRQRIAWGTAFMWNPMDILNPFNPIQLERQERQGIDAALLDWDYSALSRVSLVYASQKSGDSAALRWRSNVQNFDLSLMAGRFRGDEVAGFDFAGQISNVGIRGEVTRSHTPRRDDFTRMVVGADYTFANSLSFNIEFYYNGQGSTASEKYQFNRLLSGEIQSLAQHYLGIYSAYDIAPLIRWHFYLILNLDDNSRFASPQLNYSLTENVEIALAGQFFDGGTATEYGSLETLYYCRLQWYF